ncbi:MAG TPA: hypothetical protein EYN67_03660 [Flavobacteriales bacterium]|nr:hypothetical protein [Flavobacteriales bacterium]
MARVTLGDRLEVLASSPHLSNRDRVFAASLLAHYQKRRSLTSGRRVWVDRLEAMAEEIKNRDPSEYESLVIEIEDMMTRVESDGWSADFLASIRDQAKRVGARLSTRQQEIFDKIKSENTPEMVERRGRWAQEYRTHHLETATVLANYYLQTGYWTHMARDIIEHDDYVPPMDKFQKMSQNKFAAKVLAAWRADPKYPVGTSVIERRNQPHRLQKGGMVLSTTEPIVNAAAGSKRYLVLPYGSTVPVSVEERCVKLFRGRGRAKSPAKI